MTDTVTKTAKQRYRNRGGAVVLKVGVNFACSAREKKFLTPHLIHTYIGDMKQNIAQFSLL